MNLIESSSRCVTLLIVLFLTSGCYSSREKAEQQTFYRVTKVVDGDTFWVDDGSPKGRKIRLIGVDAPETRKSATKDVGYYGEEAKVYLTKMLLDKEVRLEYDVDRKDRYGRTLAYAYLLDGTFVNAELLRNGYSMVLTVPPNVKYANDFVELQRVARERQKGLWSK